MKGEKIGVDVKPNEMESKKMQMKSEEMGDEGVEGSGTCENERS